MTATERLSIRATLARKDFQLKVDIDLPATGITVLFGPSGSGKTTLLRCVAGLERPDDGLVRIGQECWQDNACGIYRPAWQRDLGYVFQEPSLLAHLDVLGNLAYGLKRSRKAGSAEALGRSIALLGIGHLLQRQPASLSGGERQRVAIARALATQPRLLLLDEPLASLDLARRQEILPWLEKMRDELQLPMLYVTHSADELTRLADHLVVLDRGCVRACGPALNVLAQVDSAVIVGEDAGIVLTGSVAQRDEPWHLAQVAFPGGHLWVRDNAMPLGQRVRLRILARDVSLTIEETRNTSIQNHLAGRIDAIVDDVHPSQALVRIRCGESVLLARITRRAINSLKLTPGATVWAQVKSVAVIE